MDDLKHIIPTKFLFAASLYNSRKERSGGVVSGIGHEVYFFACVILTSYIKDHENLALLEKSIPFKFWLLSAE